MDKKRFKFFKIIALLLILTSVYQIVNWIQDARKSNHTYLELRKSRNHQTKESKKETMLVNPPPLSTDIYWNYTDTPFFQADFKDLKTQNKHTTAWILIKDTHINYPIVKTTDNSYYLNHSFDQSKNKAGWIFFDFRNDFLSTNRNWVVYGHNRLDGTMFGNLKEMLKTEWFETKEHHLIYLSTPTSNFIFQIFSVYTIPKESYYMTTHFLDSVSYQTFISTLQDRSIIPFTTYVDENDQLLTLSTCKNDFGIRTVVHAKLIKKETK